MDKSAVGFQENPDRIGTNYTKTKPDIGAAKPSNLRAKFENLAKTSTEEDQKRTAEQKRIREEKDRLDREQAAKKSVRLSHWSFHFVSKIRKFHYRHSRARKKIRNRHSGE